MQVPHIYRITLVTTAVLLSVISLSAQTITDSSPEEENSEKIQVENADRSIRLKEDQMQQLLGNVRLAHDSIYMFCDSAWITDNRIEALGEIIIIQDDTINVFSDSLYYNGDNKIAKLYRNVVMKNGNKNLFSKELIYDLNTKVATFSDTSTLISNTMTLSSLRGKYDVDSKMAYFYDEVSIIDGDLRLKTDSLRYDTDVDRAYFLGPTYITQDSKQIYCTDGFYDIEEGRAHFAGDAMIIDGNTKTSSDYIYYSEKDGTLTLESNAEISDSTSITRGDKIIIYEKTEDIQIIGNGYYADDEQTIEGKDILYNKSTKNLKLNGRSTILSAQAELEGDTINFDNLTSTGIAYGNVIYTDTVNSRFIYTDYMTYNDSTEYYKATVGDLRPLLIQTIDEDSIYVSADTLLSYTDTTSVKVLEAVGDVRIYKSDLQAVCDSLYYSDRDSIFYLYKRPISWSDTTQILGDTLSIKLENDKVSEIIAHGNALIVSQEAADYYNQIKGKLIHSYLDSNELRRMEVTGNAESIYLIKDDDEAYIGTNKTLCSRMTFLFSKEELDNILFLTQPNNTMVPMKDAQQSDLFLESFIWHDDVRPKDILGLRYSTVRRQDAKPQVDKDEVDTFSESVNNVLKQESKKSEKSDKFAKKSKGDK